MVEMLAWTCVLTALLALPLPAAARLPDGKRPPQDGGELQGITVEGGLAEDGTRRQYSCPARFLRMGNSCYFLSTHMASWQEAHFKCRNMGSVLAAFEKRNENNHMRKHLLREEMAPLSRWIGGIYQWQKRFWMWGSTGLAVAYTAFPRRMVHRDWAWHCIAMDPSSDYKWRPANCLEPKHYICETPLRKHHRPAGPPQGRNGTKQHNGPRRRPGADGVLDKPKVVLAPLETPGAQAQGRGTVRWRYQSRVNGVAASRRWSTPGSRPRTTHLGDRTAHRRGPNSRVGGGLHPPLPPQHPRQPGGPGGGRPSGAGFGAVAGGTRHQVRQHVDYNAYVVESTSPPPRPSPGRPGPRSREDKDAERKPFYIPEPEASVQSLYPPPSASEKNDFSNDV